MMEVIAGLQIADAVLHPPHQPSPVAWPSSMMRDRYNFEFLMTNPIDQTKRKIRKEIPTRIMQIARPAFGGFVDSFDANGYLRRKGLSSYWTPLSIPPCSGFDFFSRCRMKFNLHVWHQ